MKIEFLYIIFIFLLFNSVSVYAQDFGEKWSELLGEDVKGWLVYSTPDTLINALESFGIPRNLTVEWGGLIFYIIVPLLTFLIVIRAIVVDQVIIRMLGMGTAFGDWKGWLFSVLLVALLIPTGWFGILALWLYGAAGILAVYGFGVLLILGLLIHFAAAGQRLSLADTVGIGKGWFTGALVAIFLVFLFGGAGLIGSVILSIIATIFIALGFKKLNPPEKQVFKVIQKGEKEEEQIAKAIEWVENSIVTVKSFPNSHKKDRVIESLTKLRTDLRTGSYNKTMQQRIRDVRDEIKAAYGIL